MTSTYVRPAVAGLLAAALTGTTLGVAGAEGLSLDPKLADYKAVSGVSGSLKVDMSGSFYVGKAGYPEVGQAKEAKKLMKPEGEWNTFRIEARGDTFTCWINGTKASQYTDAKFTGAAPLGLQIHPNVKMRCDYRNIRVAELK